GAAGFGTRDTDLVLAQGADPAHDVGAGCAPARRDTGSGAGAGATGRRWAAAGGACPEGAPAASTRAGSGDRQADVAGRGAEAGRKGRPGPSGGGPLIRT